MKSYVGRKHYTRFLHRLGLFATQESQLYCSYDICLAGQRAVSYVSFDMCNEHGEDLHRASSSCCRLQRSHRRSCCHLRSC
jgi:hypothetical protein